MRIFHPRAFLNDHSHLVYRNFFAIWFYSLTPLQQENKEDNHWFTFDYYASHFMDPLDNKGLNYDLTYHFNNYCY